MDLSKVGRALAAGPRRGAGDDRDRRPDAAARLRRAAGAEERRRHQRRGASLLPREAAERRRGRAQGRGQGRGEEEQRGRAPLDLRHRGAEAQGRRARRLRPLGDAVLPARLGLRRGHAVPLGGQRLLADGRDRDAASSSCRACRSPTTCPASDMPVYRNLWDHIGKEMPKKGRGKSGELDPLELPTELQTALYALYGHYEKTFEEWKQAGIDVPPVFIVVCNNTSTSKLVYEWISGLGARARRRDERTSCIHGPSRAVPQLRRVRQPAAAPEHASDRQRAARIRRGARREFPRNRRRRRSSSSSAR